MNALSIYLVSVPVGHCPDYDCTRQLVVVATSPEDAQRMANPSPMLTELYPDHSHETPTPRSHWDIDISKLVVLHLGSARLGAIPGVVCEDNRGA